MGQACAAFTSASGQPVSAGPRSVRWTPASRPVRVVSSNGSVKATALPVAASGVPHRWVAAGKVWNMRGVPPSAGAAWASDRAKARAVSIRNSVATGA